MAPPPVSGSAAYKKKDGTLELAKDQKTITWTPKAGPTGSFTIQVASITSMFLGLVTWEYWVVHIANETGRVSSFQTYSKHPLATLKLC